MGDEKHYTVQLKGVAYRFKPLPPQDVQRLVTALHLSIHGTKLIKTLTKVLAASAGEDQWDAITDRYLADELALEEFTVRLFERLIKRQDKDGLIDAPEDAE